MRAEEKPIYLDYHSTTPVDPQVMAAMLPWFSENFGNPASRSHAFGWKASEAVEIARAQVADLLSVNVGDIIFTSGSTEGLNLAIKGLAESLNYKGNHIITVATEHHAVLDPIQWLVRKGFEVTILTVNRDGIVEPNQIKSAIRKDTLMVVVMWANNETGVVQDINEIGEVCTEAGVILISDATQSIGKMKCKPNEAGVDILALSAHKFYGPKGVGALYINQSAANVKPAALIHGGGHEKGYRSGTLNVPGIVGMGVAASLCKEQIDSGPDRIKHLRDHFERTILSDVEETEVNGHIDKRLPTVSNLKVRFVDSQAVMSRFRTRLAISSGSACSSANPEPSHVLLAMGLTPTEAKGSFRFSWGRTSTIEETTIAARIFKEAIALEREQSPVWQMFRQGIDVSDA